ncbi:MAG: phosphate transport system substrate-binding protein [Halocynthiibacter sp.]|jgi:phosphate transport system substrate-binding protein
MQIFRAAICAALFLFGMAASAQDVTLTSRDGSVALSGMLLGYDGEFYRIDSDYGVLTVDGSGVNCEGPGCPDLENFVARVRFSGARTMGEVLMPALIEAFAARNGYQVGRLGGDEPTRYSYQLSDRKTGALSAEFAFHASSSEEGFADLLAEEADIVLSLREVRRDEVLRGHEIGLGRLSDANRSRVVALDGLVPLVPKENPLRTIPIENLGALFAGEITNWQDIGGQDAPVALHLRAEGSGLADVFMRRVMGPSGKNLAAEITLHDTNASLAEAVARDPYAIGMGSQSERGRTKALALTGACGFAASANPRSLKTEDYPLTAPLFLYIPARRLPALAREFLAYVQSPPAQMVIRRAGFVDQSLSEIPLSLQGARLSNAIQAAGPEISLEALQAMVTALDGAKRLSLSFRFEGGSTALDAQSRSNVMLLARAMEAGIFDGRSLLFAGFSDGAGAASLNKRLSERRAKVVRDAIQRAAPSVAPRAIEFQIEPFGEAMPMACDDTDWGRELNRRVEVWVR